MFRSIVAVLILGSLIFMVGCGQNQKDAGKEPEKTQKSAFKPPALITVDASVPTSAGYLSISAFFSTLSEANPDLKFRVIPCAASSERVNLLKDHVADVAMLLSDDAYFGLLGKEDFEKIGPQPLRLLWNCGPLGQGIIVRGNSDIKTIQDVKGKKFASYPISNLQKRMDATLAFAGLSKNDVVHIPIASYGAGVKALLDGSCDAVYASTTGADPQELFSSPSGARWIPLPHSNKEGWARFQEVIPFLYPYLSTQGVGISKEKPYEGWAWNYQITVLNTMDEQLAYWLTKNIHELYDKYKKVHPYNTDWTLQYCMDTKTWVTPWHPGSIKYFKDKGLWTKEHEDAQAKLQAQYPK